jgi:hypothetical protein
MYARHVQVLTAAQQQGMPGRLCTSADNSLQACAAGGVEATYMMLFSAGVADLVTMQLWARYCQAPVRLASLVQVLMVLLAAGRLFASGR